MTLQEKLSAHKARFLSGKPPFDRVPPTVHAIMKHATDELIASDAVQHVRKSGLAPTFELMDADGTVVRLADVLAKGPVVLSFYRGVWCPYCNLELQELELYAAKIREAGASLLAITPQTAVNSRKSITDHKLSFQILSDSGNKVAEQYGLRYRLPDYLSDLYKQLGVNLPAFNGDDSWTLPMPARFVIDSSGQIRYAEANPDYTQRPEPSDLLPVLETLNGDRSMAL